MDVHIPKLDLAAPNPRRELVRYSTALRAEPQPSATDLVVGFLPYLDPAAKKAALLIAQYIDNHPEYRDPKYHNVAHYFDVAAAALTYALADHGDPTKRFPVSKLELTAADIADCFIAGLLHDLGHPGGNNGDDAFKLEQESWKLAEPLLKAAGYRGKRLARMKFLILGTEPKLGIPAVENMARGLAGTGGMAARTAAKAALDDMQGKNGILDMLLDALADPKTTAMSYMVNKADLAFSLMRETSLRNVTALHNEIAISGRQMAYLDENGEVIIAGQKYFLDNMAFVDDGPFPVNGVEIVIGAEARKIRRDNEAKLPQKPVTHYAQNGCAVPVFYT